MRVREEQLNLPQTGSDSDFSYFKKDKKREPDMLPLENVCIFVQEPCGSDKKNILLTN